MRRSIGDDVADFLKGVLASNTLVSSVDVYTLAKKAGFGVRTIKKVKKELGIKSVRVNNRWYFTYEVCSSEPMETADEYVKEC